MRLLMAGVLALSCPAPVTGVLDLRPLRQVAYDYQPYRTPEAMARGHGRVAVAGTAAGWVAGPKKDQVLLRIQVTERFRGTTRPHVYFETYRGSRDAKGAYVHSLSDFRRAVPRGVRLVLVGREKTDQPGVYGVPPQGLILQQVTTRRRELVYALDTVPAWQFPCGIAGLAARLRSARLT
ncbi:hypothetical protein ACIBEJ_40980 [Nonomuraea sp. NPDC050790]|uniref:hypothetical protein n=1 Tax=Nonomuraea sp. NPDC050790 TaxID=3364371 RepID=UPI00379603D3